MLATQTLFQHKGILRANRQNQRKRDAKPIQISRDQPPPLRFIVAKTTRPEGPASPRAPHPQGAPNAVSGMTKILEIWSPHRSLFAFGVGLHHFVRGVDVRGDVLNIIIVFQRFDQLHHLGQPVQINLGLDVGLPDQLG